MKGFAKGAALAGSAAALLWVSGCDGKPATSTSTQEANVKGTVTINGALATEGQVVFDPSNIDRKDAMPAVLPIGKDGTYSGKTLVGGNSVSVLGPAAEKDHNLARWHTSVDVKPGDNNFPITAPE